jgi:hypothetical protein
VRSSKREEFEARGVTWLRGAVDGDAVAEVCEQIWKALGENAGVDRDTRSPHQFQKPNAKATRALKKTGAFDLIYSEAVRASADTLLGHGQWGGTPSGPGLLLTLPGQPSWALPHKVWHFDYRCPGGREGLPGVQPFLCLDRVEPEGGGTLVVAGSHRLVARIQQAAGGEFAGKSADVRKQLSREVPWLRALFSLRAGEDRVSRFMAHETEHEGVSLQVVEFVGEPGDVILMHPWIVHSLSPNCSGRTRMVLTDRLRSKAHPF